MAHELDFTKGKAAIAYKATNGTPWHGYGEYITDDMNAAQIAKVAGLDFEVLKAPAFYNIPNPNYNKDDADSPQMLTRSYENRAVMYRSDTGDALSVMSESHYEPMQPIELLEGLMGLVKGKGFEMDVAGALKGGQVVWGLAKRKDEQGEIGKDVIKPYILLLSSYNGTYARTARMTSVRVVCQNTLSLSGMTDKRSTSRQRNSAEFNEEAAIKLFENLGQYDKEFADYMTLLKSAAKVKLTDDKLARFFAKLYAPKALKDESNWLKSELDFDRTGVTSNQRNNIVDLLGIFRDSPGANLPSANGTLFGALQSVTYYQDHAARTKQNKRWESATIGQGNKSKDDALALTLEMLGA
jgi:phage/plasmid-like protein (TIGR03299 family)